MQFSSVSLLILQFYRSQGSKGLWGDLVCVLNSGASVAGPSLKKGAADTNYFCCLFIS